MATTSTSLYKLYRESARVRVGLCEKRRHERLSIDVGGGASACVQDCLCLFSLCRHTSFSVFSLVFHFCFYSAFLFLDFRGCAVGGLLISLCVCVCVCRPKKNTQDRWCNTLAMQLVTRLCFSSSRFV